ncbi:SAM-dependent methyltransferase [uncultured Methanoregula sp.]|uniref:SAM-dependent methyltransferase n=1 Tax=uncultured Methanoregula sp. TaxID=1005933 RepID=UPI002AAC0E62|nr:SAM-dependent methyltransferase [uncultured Methanoregula sp.]
MKLIDFLLSLATDSDIFARFRREPDVVMTEANLLESERQTISDGDPRKLFRLLLAESQDSNLSSDIKIPPQFEVSNQPTISPPPNIVPPPPPPNYLYIGPVSPPPPISNISPPPPPPPQNGPPPPYEVHISKAPTQFQESIPSWFMPERLWDAMGLTVVGTGIRGGLQTTPEARICIEQASKVYYIVADPISENLILTLNSTAESLMSFYQVGKSRLDAYNSMVEKVVSSLQEYRDVCLVLYGHPGVFSYPARESIRLARLKGIGARMLPGISTEDNLIADLCMDPGQIGLQSYEATAFLLNKYKFDISVGMILWQVGVLGETIWNPPHPEVRNRLTVLSDYLIEFYGNDHEVVFYHASQLPSSRPVVERFPLSELSKAQLMDISTLFIPPKISPTCDIEMVKKLGMKWGE